MAQEHCNQDQIGRIDAAVLEMKVHFSCLSPSSFPAGSMLTVWNFAPQEPLQGS